MKIWDNVRKKLENYDKSNPKEKKKSQEIFKTLMFGWKFDDDYKYTENIFERILADPAVADLVSLVWEKFELWQNGFILSVVSSS